MRNGAWPFRLERRAEPSIAMSIVSPMIAAAAMLLTGFILFTALGKSPAEAFHIFFVEPVASLYGIGELLLKATPLMLCALGLAIGFRANVWNIGAEGQFILGAIAGGARGIVCQRTRRTHVADHAARRRARRHGVGCDCGLVAHPLSHQRDPGHADVGLHRTAAAVVLRARAMARSRRFQLSAVGSSSRSTSCCRS